MESIKSKRNFDQMSQGGILLQLCLYTTVAQCLQIAIVYPNFINLNFIF